MNQICGTNKRISQGKTMLKSLLLLLQSTNAHAQAAAGAPAQNPMLQFLPLVVVFVIFYFLMIRPQKKKFDEEQALLNKLAKGDEIYTKAGFIGTIFGINDKIVDLEIADGVRVKVLKSQVGGLAKSVLETSK
jgi:preprotein translocase subunit YajC